MNPARRQGPSGEGAAAPTDAGGEAIKVTQVRSSIGSKPKHRGTLRALGLRGVGRSRVLPDRPEIRGMLARVPHLVEVEAATASELSAERGRVETVRAQRRAKR